MKPLFIQPEKAAKWLLLNPPDSIKKKQEFKTHFTQARLVKSANGYMNQLPGLVRIKLLIYSDMWKYSLTWTQFSPLF